MNVGKHGGATTFSLVTTTMMLIGVVAAVLMFSFLYSGFGLLTGDNVEASERDAFYDVRKKIGELTELTLDSDPKTAYGTIGKDARFISFNSGDRKVTISDGEEVRRPKNLCGSNLNSCICLCQTKNCGSDSLCKSYFPNDIKYIVASKPTVTTRVKNFNYKDGSEGYYLLIDGSKRRSVTVLLDLQLLNGDRILYIERVGS